MDAMATDPLVQEVTTKYSPQDAWGAIKRISTGKAGSFVSVCCFFLHPSHIGPTNDKDDALFWVWNALWHLQDILTLLPKDPRPPRLKVFDSALDHIWMCNCIG